MFDIFILLGYWLGNNGNIELTGKEQAMRWIPENIQTKNQTCYFLKSSHKTHCIHIILFKYRNINNWKIH